MSRAATIDYGAGDSRPLRRLLLSTGLSLALHVGLMFVSVGRGEAARLVRLREFQARQLARLHQPIPVEAEVSETRFDVPEAVAQAFPSAIPPERLSVAPAAREQADLPPERERTFVEPERIEPQLPLVTPESSTLPEPSPGEKPMPRVTMGTPVPALNRSRVPVALVSSFVVMPPTQRERAEERRNRRFASARPEEGLLPDVLPPDKPYIGLMLLRVPVPGRGAWTEETDVTRAVPNSPNERGRSADVARSGRAGPAFQLLLSPVDLLGGEPVRLGETYDPTAARAGSRSYGRLGAYGARIQRSMNRHAFYPPLAQQRGYEGSVTVRFLVASDGTLLDVKILLPSDYEILNQAALKLVRDAAPFLPLPAEVGEPAVLFEMEIEYRLR